MRKRVSLMASGLLLAAAAAAPAAEAPAVLGVGRPAPPLELAAADGATHSLATLEGPAVLIFFRGLW